MTSRVLRVGTRGSALALAQSGQMAGELARRCGAEPELVRIKTEGDLNQGPLATIGGTGVFVTAVRTALLAGEVDLVVHSFKDLPTAEAPGLSLAVVPQRENPADALCALDGATLAELRSGARVGTGSPRRAAQLLAIRPDLRVEPLRGNVDSRLARVTSGELAGVVLAMAGLARLGRTDAVTELLAPPTFLPAPAQGALAIECRAEDLTTQWFSAALAAADHPETRAAALAERSLLAALEAGCTAPVGAHAVVSGNALRLTGAVFAVDGSRQVRGDHSGPADLESAERLGRELADRLLADGAGALLGAAR